MNFDQIRTFITVVEAGNITAAAQVLFTSQSNISRKINQIEEELGVPLIVRSKGQQSVELTAHGEKFMKYAQQCASIEKDMNSIKEESNRQYLSVGCIDAFNALYFVPFYKHFVKKHPEICLSLHTYHSSEILPRLQNHQLDIGYVIKDKPQPDLTANLLFQDPMVILAAKPNNYYDGISLTELPAEKEIFLRWNDHFDEIHTRYFPGKKYKVRVSTESMLYSFLDEPGCWSIASQSCARAMMKKLDVNLYYPKEPFAPQRCYEIENIQPRMSRAAAIQTFKEEFHNYIRNNISEMLSYEKNTVEE